MQLINSQFQVTFPSPKWISIRFCCNAIGFRRAICIRKLNFSNCDYMHFYQRFNVYICLYLDYNIVNLFHNTLSNPIRLFFLSNTVHYYHTLNPNWKLGKKLYFSSLLECFLITFVAFQYFDNFLYFFLSRVF